MGSNSYSIGGWGFGFVSFDREVALEICGEGELAFDNGAQLQTQSWAQRLKNYGSSTTMEGLMGGADGVEGEIA